MFNRLRLVMALLLTLTMVGGMFAWGCSPAAPATPTPTTPATPAVLQPKSGGTLLVPSSVAPGGWDMHMRPMYGPYFALPVFNGLVQFNPLKEAIIPENIIGDLAEKWDVAADGKTFTFYLRKNVKWHDGSAFTADDAVYSIEKMMDPKRSAVTGFYPTFDRVEKVDASTLKIYLKAPSAAFLVQLAGPYAVMQAKSKAGTDMRTVDFAMGTGPFKLGKVTPGVNYEYVKNPDYFKKDAAGRALPYLDAVTIYIMAMKDAQTEAMISGRIDMGELVGTFGTQDQLDKFKGMAKPGQFVVKPMTAGRPGPFIWFNMANDIVKDVRVRKAIGLLVEPEQFVIAVSGTKEWGDYNIAIMTGGGSGYGLPKADVDKLLGRDMAWDARVAAAKKLMADAGKSAGFKAKLTYGNYDVHQRRAALLADTLKKNLNIELTLNPVEPAQARTVFLKGDFDLCIDQLTAVIGDPDEIVSYYKTGGSANQSKYSNADVDKLFDQQSQSLDVAARRQITRQIERQLLTDLPQIPTAGLVTQISWASYVNYPMQMMSYGSNQALEYVWLNK